MLQEEKVRRARVQKIVLNTILAVGLMSVSMLAPNAVQALKMFDGGRKRKKNPKHVIQNAINRLIEKEYITFEKTSKGTFAKLTDKGEARLRLVEAHDFNIKKPKHWDGKWRVIIFDVPEKRKGLRDKIRLTLNNIGFVRLQDSVFVYPYPCEDLIVLLKADFKIGKDVIYIIADSIENDRELHQHFNLKN